MEILFKTSNFDYETKKICTVCINALFEQYIGKVEGLKYFVICDTEINAFNKTINEFAKYFNSETYAENTEMYQVGAKALHGTDNNGKLCSAVVFKSGIILCLLSDLYGNPSQDKATSECSLQWMGITTVLHEIGHVINYNTLSKIDPYFISNKIRYDISIPKEKEEYVQRSCLNLWSEYFADTYVFRLCDNLRNVLHENEDQLISSILEYYGNNISVEERVYRILYFYSRLVAQQGLEYSNNILKNSKIMCYSGFLGTFGTELMALHNTYPNWNANNSFHRITSIYNLFLAYEKSIKMIR